MWTFRKRDRAGVEQGITQRNDFNNEDKELSENLIRETIQNSLDARDGKANHVEVKFSLLKHSSDSKTYLKTLMKDAAQHIKASKIEIPNNEKDSALVIEDYGTSGLTGSTDDIDDGNFTNFWRKHGLSEKTGSSLGRWGLGKLVYSGTSVSNTFFGLTIRKAEGDEHRGPFLMGQTVLSRHSIGENDYETHGMYGTEPEGDDFVSAITEKKDIDQFVETFKLDRHEKPGLSIVIPYPKDIDFEKMIEHTINNYYFALITSDLKVTFDKKEINSDTIFELAKKSKKGPHKQPDIFLKFIKEAADIKANEMLKLKESWIDDQKLDEDDFELDELEEIRERYKKGELISLLLPITLIKNKANDDETVNTEFSVFIQKPDSLEAGQGIDLYQRGFLSVPGQKRFKYGENAFALLYAKDKAICSFLAEAENAAHEKWILNTEKLKAIYNEETRNKIKGIRDSLQDLYGLLEEVVEEENLNALNNFFYVVNPENEPSPAKKKKKKPRPSPEPVDPLDIKPKQKVIFKATRHKTGFKIQAGEDLQESDLPIKATVKMGYMGDKEKFVKGDDHNFVLGRDFKIKQNVGISTPIVTGSVIRFEIEKTYFFIEATDFDEHRDLMISIKRGYDE